VKEGRVLVVDDEPMVRDTLGQVLTDEGYVVDVAVDGQQALDRVQTAKPNVILLDLMMPGMNGRQFLQQLRGNPDYASVPVLIMTAVHGMSVNLATIGASEVVEKPFNVDDLLNKVALRRLSVTRRRQDLDERADPADHRSPRSYVRARPRRRPRDRARPRAAAAPRPRAIRARVHRRVDDARARPSVAARSCAPAARDPRRSAR